MRREYALGQLLNETIGAVPPQDQFEHILRFMPCANAELLRHALKELKATAQRNRMVDIAERLRKVYHRKVAEQGSLHPVFHAVESAYRSTLAFWLEDHYRLERWWEPSLTRLQEIERQNYPAPLTHINGVPVSRGAGRALDILIKNVEGDRLDRNVLAGTDSHGVLARAKMSDIAELISEHWAQFKNELSLTLPNGKPLDQGVFAGLFKRLREARNEAYHHREVSRRAEIVAVGEELLDLIDVHLVSTLETLSHAPAKPLAATVARQPRHVCLPETAAFFSVETVAVGRNAVQTSVVASCTGEALMKHVVALSGEARNKLKTITVDAVIGNAVVAIPD